jgi:hypothetical protein
MSRPDPALCVMAGLVPAIQPSADSTADGWLLGTSPRAAEDEALCDELGDTTRATQAQRYFARTFSFHRAQARRWMFSSTSPAFSPSSLSRKVMSPPIPMACSCSRALVSV